jgi:hypothetical protein
MEQKDPFLALNEYPATSKNLSIIPPPGLHSKLLELSVGLAESAQLMRGLNAILDPWGAGHRVFGGYFDFIAGFCSSGNGGNSAD